MILEVIILAGTFAAEEVCATTLLESGIIKHVIDHLNGEYFLIFCLHYVTHSLLISYPTHKYMCTYIFNVFLLGC